MQVAGRRMHGLACLVSASAFLIAVTAASAEEAPQTQHHQVDSASHEGSCNAAITEGSVKSMGLKVNDSVLVAVKATEVMIGK